MSKKLQLVLCSGLLLAACKSEYQQAKASIYLIDRKCDILETTTTTAPNGLKTQTGRAYTGDCRSVEQWEEARAKRDKNISGKATMMISYISPQDGVSRTGELRFTARDDEFYDLKAGDEIAILVHDKDPTRIRRA